MTAITIPQVRPFGASPSQAEIYRRRRLVAALAVIVLAFCLFLAGRATAGLLGSGPLTAAETRGVPVVALDTKPVAETTYVVRTGDTLWSIARRVQPVGDVRPLVDALAETRGGHPLQPGERIVLP